MKLAIVQLSDIHIKGKNDKVFRRLDALAASVADVPEVVDHILVLVTGDVAFSGKKTEYQAAETLFKSIIEAFKKRKYTEYTFLFIPGNHDCDLTSSSTAVRDALISSLLEDPSKYHEDFTGPLCSVLKDFQAFIKNYPPPKPIFTSPLLTVYRLDICGSIICVQCFTSSWMSRLPEKQGGLLIPPSVLDQVPDVSDGALSIILIHHPLNWFLAENARLLRDHIHETCHLLFTGHEHLPGAERTIRIHDKVETQTIEGDVLQDSNNSSASGYNVILVDIAAKEYKCFRKTLGGNVYQTSALTDLYLPLTMSTVATAESLRLSDDMQRRLDEVGAPFIHPRKQRLESLDLYVYPELKPIMVSEKSTIDVKKGRISSLDLLAKSSGARHRIVLGAANSGKTQLCYQMFRRKYADKYITVYVEGQDIQGKSIDSFCKLLGRKYKDQYASADADYFSQQSNSMKYIYIDGLDRIRLNAPAQLHLLRAIFESFPNCFCTADLSFALMEVGGNPKSSPLALPTVELFQLLPFGQSLRTALIRKWLTLGQEDTLSQAELLRQHDTLKRTINTVIGKNLIPAYPFFY